MQPREGCWSVVRLTIVPFGSVRKLRRTSTKSLSDSTNVTPFFGFVDEELPGKGIDVRHDIFSSSQASYYTVTLLHPQLQETHHIVCRIMKKLKQIH